MKFQRVAYMIALSKWAVGRERLWEVAVEDSRHADARSQTNGNFLVETDPGVHPGLRAYTRVRPDNSPFFDCDLA